MKIRINKMALWLPSVLIKTKFIFKLINKDDIMIDNKEFHQMMVKIYRHLKQYKKKYGPIVLVDISSATDSIKITF